MKVSGLTSSDVLARQLRLRHQASRLVASRCRARRGGERVDHHEADVVPGAAVALAGVAQSPTTRRMASVYFFSFFSAFFVRRFVLLRSAAAFLALRVRPCPS